MDVEFIRSVTSVRPGSILLRRARQDRLNRKVDWTTGAVVLLLAGLIGYGVYANLTAEKPTADPQLLAAPAERPPPVVEPTALVEAEGLLHVRWSDDPVELMRELEFGGVLYSPTPGGSRARINHRMVKVGDTLRGDYTVALIERDLVILRDRDDKLHRLIERSAWGRVISEYGWYTLPDEPPAMEAAPEPDLSIYRAAEANEPGDDDPVDDGD